MPIYAYRCESCGHEAEVLQKISEVPLVDCPECGKTGMKKLISAAGFQLKGSGWYATDFKEGSRPKKDEPKKDELKKAESKKGEPKKNNSKADGEAKTGAACGAGDCPD